MRILWSAAAQADLGRLHQFLAQHDLDAADAALDRLVAAPEALVDFPRRGSRLSEFDPREVREFRAGSHLLRYELAKGDILVLRLFHAREDRFRSI
jgi:plasmid stabilization system protein ParE